MPLTLTHCIFLSMILKGAQNTFSQQRYHTRQLVVFLRPLKKDALTEFCISGCGRYTIPGNREVARRSVDGFEHPEFSISEAPIKKINRGAL